MALRKPPPAGPCQATRSESNGVSRFGMVSIDLVSSALRRLESQKESQALARPDINGRNENESQISCSRSGPGADSSVSRIGLGTGLGARRFPFQSKAVPSSNPRVSRPTQGQSGRLAILVLYRVQPLSAS